MCADRRIGAKWKCARIGVIKNSGYVEVHEDRCDLECGYGEADVCMQ